VTLVHRFQSISQTKFLKSTESTEDAELRNKGHIFFRAFRVFRGYGFLIGLFRARSCWRCL